jgi:hypothetical protein
MYEEAEGSIPAHDDDVNWYALRPGWSSRSRCPLGRADDTEPCQGEAHASPWVMPLCYLSFEIVFFW